MELHSSCVNNVVYGWFVVCEGIPECDWILQTSSVGYKWIIWNGELVYNKLEIPAQMDCVGKTRAVTSSRNRLAVEGNENSSYDSGI